MVYESESREELTNHKNTAFDYITCPQCGEEWILTNGNKEFFEKLGYALPKRCKACRDKNREGKQ